MNGILSPGFHLAAAYESVSQGGVNEAIACPVDGFLTRSAAANYIMPQDLRVWAFSGRSAGANRFRLNTPSLREVGLPSMVPPDVSLTVPSPANVLDLMDSPLTLRKTEELVVEGTHSTVGAEVMWAGLWLGLGFIPIPAGPIYRLRGTGAITNAAGTWVSGGITFDQTIAPGRYAVVGLAVIGANLGLARLIFPGAQARPGVLAQESLGQYPHPFFQARRAGVFGYFESFAPPTLETLSVGANTSQVIYLDVVRL